jgi:nucleoside-diphosphate-sugar epimerase
MRALIVGGTGFIGPFVIRDLVEQGHDVTVFHRGEAKTALPESVRRIHGNRNDLAAHRSTFEQLAPDVVVDFVLSDDRQAKALMEIFRGLAARMIAISSQDVYRAYGVLIGREPGPPQPTPLTEESEVRRQLHPYNVEHLRMAQAAFPWITEDYDKIPVERTVLGDPALPGTVLRLPMVYGPGDPLHRFFPTLKRIDDNRPAILLEEGYARLHPPRGYIEDVAAAIALASVSDRAVGKIYNIASDQQFTELEWTQKIGEVAGWRGAVVALPKEQTPPHVLMPLNTEQDWLVSSARIRQELGYSEPFPLEVGIERTIEWERANPPAQVDPKQFDYAAEDAALEQFRLSIAPGERSPGRS